MSNRRDDSAQNSLREPARFGGYRALSHSGGKPTHDEWMGEFDGKDYPITGDPDNDTRAYKPVNDHTLALTEKKGGKTTITGRIVYSADGKTRTLTSTATDAKGTKTKATSVYDKQ
jgi:hypothetical protein